MTDAWLLAPGAVLLGAALLAFFGPVRPMLLGWQFAIWCAYVAGALGIAALPALMHGGLDLFTGVASVALAVLLLGFWCAQCDIGTQMYLAQPVYHVGPDEPGDDWRRRGPDDPDDTPRGPTPGGDTTGFDWDAFDRDRAVYDSRELAGV